jgi:hypothetical protein
MSIIFNKLDACADFFLTSISKNATKVDEGHEFTWPNYVFTSSTFRRAHLDIIDMRYTKKLLMMHLCVFPHTNDTSPIYGFDLIAGPTKVTGAFHDFSPIVYKNNYMVRHFAEKVKNLEWSKKRELPDWAMNIFSDNMIAAGNIQKEEELETILNIAKDNLTYYLKEVGNSRGDKDYTSAQNYYCTNQKKNPHTPRVMTTLGLDENRVKEFIETCLFPSAHSPASPSSHQYVKESVQFSTVLDQLEQ